MEGASRTVSVLQFKLTEPESSGRRSLRIKSRLFIRETAQPEKSL
jgi:hypothetical protein